MHVANKGGQGGVILFVESISFLGWIINQFRSKEICFHFLIINLLVFLRKVTVALFWDLGVKKFRVKLIQKWLEKVVSTYEILSLLDLVKTRSRVCP